MSEQVHLLSEPASSVIAIVGNRVTNARNSTAGLISRNPRRSSSLTSILVVASKFPKKISIGHPLIDHIYEGLPLFSSLTREK